MYDWGPDEVIYQKASKILKSISRLVKFSTFSLELTITKFQLKIFGISFGVQNVRALWSVTNSILIVWLINVNQYRIFFLKFKRDFWYITNKGQTLELATKLDKIQGNYLVFYFKPYKFLRLCWFFSINNIKILLFMSNKIFICVLQKFEFKIKAFLVSKTLLQW